MLRDGRKTFALVFFLSALLMTAHADDWSQWRGANRDGVWKEKDVIEKFDGPEIKIRWRAPISNGYSGPTVANGRVYVMDRVVEPKERERVHCLDWETGKMLWTHAYDCAYRGFQFPNGPRASVTVNDGRAYSIGSMGNLNCFDAATGKVLWSKDLNTEYKIRMPMWGIAASPLIEGDLVIVQIGGENACFVALDRKTGAERWRALNDKASYSSPIAISQAGKRVLVCWTESRVVGLDPQTGNLHWEHPFPPRTIPQNVATPVLHTDRLFVSAFFDGSLMLRLLPDRLAVEKVWQRSGQNERSTDSLHCCISTPLIIGDYVYGLDSYGELRCLDANTGNRVWENLDVVPRARWANVHFVQNGDKVWMFNEKGQLIIGRLSPKGFEELSRAQLIKPTRGQLNDRGGVCWSHPAFAYKHVFVRNDEELVCASLEARK